MSIRSFRYRMAAFAIVVAAAVSLSAASAASAAVAPSAHPTISAELKAAIAKQLAYNPSGTVIDANQISYDHGTVIVTLSVAGQQLSPAYTCPANAFCFFAKPGLKGNGYAVLPSGYSTDTFYRISAWYPNAVLGSVHNKWSHRVFISRTNPPGSGPNHCYPPGGTGSPNEDLSWAYFGTSNTC
jgi:hypothetical protein